eukprot:m.820754 g.820754  ORF g.820754 m.820754 type:complete len:231 (+) comp23398_c2_seq3:171-863(+)
MRLLTSIVVIIIATVDMIGATVPLPAQYFHDQHTDHFQPQTVVPKTFTQRYYSSSKYFRGPGAPIFCIMGGEGGIEPATGIFYPWVAEVLAKQFGALVIEPEHRFYGKTLPVGPPPWSRKDLLLLSPQQALADAANFITFQRQLHNCSRDPGDATYCPVVTFGGSYPGFLSAMMRLRYPAVVDMAYAASAPMKFYAQQVDQYACNRWILTPPSPPWDCASRFPSTLLMEV